VLFRPPSINNAGVVGYHLEADQLIRTGLPTTPIADTLGVFGNFDGRPSINDAGAVAFLADLDTGVRGVFIGQPGGLFTTVADTSGAFAHFLGPIGPSLNNAGAVAFIARRDDGSTGVFVGSGGPIMTIADSGGPFSDFRNVSINDLGQVAFDASTDPGSNVDGIFVGADPVADRVINRGDLLFGSVVQDLRISPQAINNSGQIAFFASFSDGTQGIYRADPVLAPVPEPSTILLKDYRFTNVCFARDNDLDGQFDEDPVDGVDNDGDGKIDEDPVDCPSGTSAGIQLPTDSDGDFQVQAVLKQNGTLSSYNPGQVYAVSTVTPLADLDGLTITENYADCTDDTPQILTLNPAVGGGGGSVVVVIDTGDGVLKQILDANSPGMTVTNSQATVTLTDIAKGTIIRVYVKFGPGAKRQVLGLPTSCENETSAQVLDEAGSPVGNEVKATAVLEVTAKP
jgi:hypothetical protein